MSALASLHNATLGDDFAIAALLWSVGADTHEIAERLHVRESVIYAQLDAIKEAAREIKAGRGS